MSECVTLFKKQQEEKAYKIYVTDCLRLITENTARLSNGSYISARFAEALDPPKQDERTAEEIIASIKTKLKKEADVA